MISISILHLRSSATCDSELFSSLINQFNIFKLCNWSIWLHSPSGHCRLSACCGDTWSAIFRPKTSNQNGSEWSFSRRHHINVLTFIYIHILLSIYLHVHRRGLPVIFQQNPKAGGQVNDLTGKTRTFSESHDLPGKSWLEWLDSLRVQSVQSTDYDMMMCNFQQLSQFWDSEMVFILWKASKSILERPYIFFELRFMFQSGTPLWLTVNWL